jgi:hypothetical protein
MDHTYCPKCGSRLYPADEHYMAATGVCSYCVTNDTTPDARYWHKWAQWQEQRKKERRKR